MENPGADLTGADVIRLSGFASGTVYQLLLRFERNGFLKSGWESGDPSVLGRPRRRFYGITAQGQAVHARALRDLRPSQTLLPAEV
jgi:PadR family transcriptional regulator, regulatory protein PadR